MQKTYMAKESTIKREWLLVDATGMPVGRLATQVAAILRGKHKPTFTPHVDTGDFVVIVNSDKVILTGKKMTDKYYFRHTGHPGGDRYTQAKDMIQKNSDRAVRLAVKGMLPKNSLGREMIKKLKIEKGPEHKHQAQQPRKITLVGGTK